MLARPPSAVVHYALEQTTRQLRIHREALPGKGVAPNGTVAARTAGSRETECLLTAWFPLEKAPFSSTSYWIIIVFFCFFFFM